MPGFDARNSRDAMRELWLQQTGGFVCFFSLNSLPLKCSRGFLNNDPVCR